MISVVIPVFNSWETATKAIESVLSQSYDGEIEIIIVNDGSTDKSYQKLNEFKIRNFNCNNRDIVLLNKPNGGVSSARNMGVIKSKYDWVAFLDSDDVWSKDKLMIQFNEIISSNGIEFIGANRNGEKYGCRNNKNIFSLDVKKIIFKWYPHTSTVLVKKEKLIAAGLYDESRTHAEDGDLWLRLVMQCNLWVINKDLVFTGNGKRSFGVSGLSSNLNKMYEGEIHALIGALERKQIGNILFLFFYIWLSAKYVRRLLISKLFK